MAFADLLHGRTRAVVLLLGLVVGCRSLPPAAPSPPASATPSGPTIPAVSVVVPQTSETAPPAIGTTPPASVAATYAGQSPFSAMSAGAPRPLPSIDPPNQNPVRPVAFPQPISGMPLEPLADDGMFAGQPQLTVEQVVDQVMARNPSIDAMASAWRAAAHRYPQVVALDDPMFMGMLAPASLGSNLVEPAYILGGSQKLPWHGKRAARGRVAQAEENAAFQDMQQTRLEIAEAARLAYYDYFLVRRELELNQENRVAVQSFRDTAKSRYESNLVTQQDVLQADVAVADVQRRLIELERMNHVAMARLNTLMLRPPDAYLPPPPTQISIGAAPASAELLRSVAVQQRPDLAALAAKVRAEQAAVSVAEKEFYPDVEVFGRYDSFWQPAATQSQLRPQAGVNMNLPIYRQKRYAALHEAQFRFAQRRAEYQQKFNDIQFEVQSASEQIQQALQTADLYSEKFLPAAEQNVRVARTSYNVGQINFLGLIQAQQQLIMLREKQQEAIADYHRRLAELEKVVGGSLPVARAKEVVPAPLPQR